MPEAKRAESDSLNYEDQGLVQTIIGSLDKLKEQVTTAQLIDAGSEEARTRLLGKIEATQGSYRNSGSVNSDKNPGVDSLPFLSHEAQQFINAHTSEK